MLYRWKSSRQHVKNDVVTSDAVNRCGDLQGGDVLIVSKVVQFMR
jgi:hypothetical protein